KIIGITGTKGKSSVAHLLTQLLTLSGHRVLLIGTTGIHFANEHKITDNTTPESLVIQEAMADALAKGATHLVIELSSQALAMQRSYGLQPDLACFLNLSPDHIGALEHPDFADYLNSKLKVFKGAKNCLFNLDDPAAAKLLKAALEALPKKQAGQLAAFGFGSPQELEQGLSRIAREAGFQGAELEEVLTRVQLYGGEELKFTSQNLSFIFQQKQISLEPAAAFLAANALATLASLDLLGELNEDLIAAIAKLHVPGRLEKIKTSKGAVIVIDYAHNELSLEALLAALKPQVKGRLLVLFGSVGEKSKERRRELPRVAERYADFVYVSSDNPGFEDPEKIVQEIGAQFSPDFKNYDLEADRELAIRRAVRSLRAGDLLVLAGKGHEKFQLVKGEHLAFDERAIVESELAAIAEDLKA
ncbi:MAG: UDP-N-acetylmuramyl-tripeptide synthetase, partial [Eubacteriales bacterium]|nr:UDP-N-acetylmuramyl-tripeptide synthetase [Eubacteriales bacterium]